MQKRMHTHADTHTDTRTNALPTLRSDEPTAKRELMANQDMNSLQENAYMLDHSPFFEGGGGVLPGLNALVLETCVATLTSLAIKG